VGVTSNNYGDYEGLSMSGADWVTAIATVTLAVIAIFQEPVRRRFFRPKFKLSAKSAPAYCMKVPEDFASPGGTVKVPAVYLRIRVENNGNATALSIEIYVKALQRKRQTDKTGEPVESFPPMNLVWSDLGGMYMPRLVPGMGKYCDVASTYDPKSVPQVRPSGDGLNPDQTRPARWLKVS
jgi:hypothetical protein